MTTCAIYIRKSRKDKDHQSQRLTVQREQLPAHARAKGWEVEIYDDGHASAARGKADDLRERGRLEADILAGKINVVLVIELSRISRDDSSIDFTRWIELCRSHNVKLATMSQVYDPREVSQWTFLSLDGVLSSAEMQRWKERIDQGSAAAFAAGKWLGGSPPAPYVYDQKNSRPVVDPALLVQMQTVWTLAETQSARAVARQLNLPEIFVRRAIADDRLLMCQALRHDPASGENIPCDWQPVIDAEQAARLRAGRRTRKKSPGIKRHAAALLSNLNLIYCGFCGRTAKTWANSKVRKDGWKNNYYACNSRNSRTDCPQSRMIQQDELDSKVLNNLFRTLKKVEELKAAWAISQEQGDIPTRMKQLAKEEREATIKKSRLVTAVAEGLLSGADIRGKKEEIDTILDNISRQRQTLLSLMTDPPDWDNLLSREDFDLIDFDEQREFVTLILKRIDIYSGHAILTYQFPRNPQGDTTSRINFDPPGRLHHKSLPASFTNPCKNKKKKASNI